MQQTIGGDSSKNTQCVSIVPDLLFVHDEVLGSSNKFWNVPDNEVWKITRMCNDLNTSSAVGNRIFTVLEETNTGIVLQKLIAGNVQAASLMVSYCCLQGIFRETSVINGSIQVPIPIDFYISGGNVLRVYDRSSVDVVNDVLIVNFQYERQRV